MATFLNIQTEIAEHSGLDVTDSNTLTRLKRWINITQQTISAFEDWSWLEARDVLTTEADITTGSVTATNASTTITFSSAPASSVANYFFQTSDSDDWYKISSHTGGGVNATLETSYAQTGGSGLSYTVRKRDYSLSSSVDRIASVRQSISPVKLGAVMTRRFDRILPDPTATGDPQWYYVWGLDSSQNWQIAFYPIPSSALLIEVRYYKKLSDLSADGDISDVPVKWHDVLIWGGLVRAATFTRDIDLIRLAKQNYIELIEQMRIEDGQTRDIDGIRRSIDETVELSIPRLPASYGDLGSDSG